jgi:hypothetical protein
VPADGNALDFRRMSRAGPGGRVARTAAKSGNERDGQRAKPGSEPPAQSDSAALETEIHGFVATDRTVPLQKNGGKAAVGFVNAGGHSGAVGRSFCKKFKKDVAPFPAIPILCAPVSPKRQNDEFGR